MSEPLMGECFKGVPRSVELRSNNIGFGPVLDPTTVIEQRFTLDDEGRADILYLIYGDGAPYEPHMEVTFKLKEDAAAEVLGMFSQIFSEPMETDFVTDCGTWELTMTNTEGMRFGYWGSLISANPELHELSATLRFLLDQAELWLFEDVDASRIIDRIHLTFNHFIQQRPLEEAPEDTEKTTDQDVSHDGSPSDAPDPNGDPEPDEHLFTETLFIDRQSQTFERTVTIYNGTTLTTQCRVPRRVNDLLGRLDVDGLLRDPEGLPPDAVIPAEDSREFILTITMSDASVKEYHGVFARPNLPDGFDSLVVESMNFLAEQEMSDIFNYGILNKVYRRPEEHYYCSVEFSPRGRTYFYRTQDSTYDIGHYVVVPVGSEGGTKVGRITDIQCFAPDEAPYPFQKTKQVIRHADPGEIPEEYGE